MLLIISVLLQAIVKGAELGLSAGLIYGVFSAVMPSGDALALGVEKLIWPLLSAAGIGAALGAGGGLVIGGIAESPVFHRTSPNELLESDKIALQQMQARSRSSELAPQPVPARTFVEKHPSSTDYRHAEAVRRELSSGAPQR